MEKSGILKHNRSFKRRKWFKKTQKWMEKLVTIQTRTHLSEKNGKVVRNEFDTDIAHSTVT